MLNSVAVSRKTPAPMTRVLKGIAAAPGIAIAPMVHFHSDLDFISTRKISPDEIPDEIQRLEDAVMATSRAILFLRHELSATLSDHDAKIYDVQLALLHDETFKADLVRGIEDDGVNAEMALQKVIHRYEKVFELAEDAAMRERAADLRDVGRQLLGSLMEKDRTAYTADGQDYIFCADEFLPSDAGILDHDHVRGIVTTRGGKYSHGSILARSWGIPALVAVEQVQKKVSSGTVVVADGETGSLIIDPGAEDVSRYRELMAEREEGQRRVFEVRFLPAVTPDGTAVSLMANVEGVRDLDHVETGVTEGIGLFRTEFAFMERREFPAEEDQVKIYRSAVERAEGRVVTFRTLDVGGDKPLDYFQTPEERNPVLGWRGLRISLDWPDILYVQIRAILRASAAGKVRILLPMVTSLEEVKQCREVVDHILSDLAKSGEPHDPHPELGIMVEVPAIVHVLDQVLGITDFVSVGTNDLVQYLLAVDRDNPRVASMYDPYHPAVLRVLKDIVERSNEADKPVAICGEIAGDHNFTPLLLGLGYRELSMIPVFLPRVKLMVRSFPIDECEALAKQALSMESAKEIRELARNTSRKRWSHFLEHPPDGEEQGSEA